MATEQAVTLVPHPSALIMVSATHAAVLQYHPHFNTCMLPLVSVP